MEKKLRENRVGVSEDGVVDPVSIALIPAPNIPTPLLYSHRFSLVRSLTTRSFVSLVCNDQEPDLQPIPLPLIEETSQFSYITTY